MTERERFAAELPHIDLGYVQAHMPAMKAKAERYMALRRVATTHKDIDALVVLRDTIVAARPSQGISRGRVYQLAGK